MKILQVRFQNLNSLAGSWHIDFTDPAYGENSLFAITGPTGAGKSTLLDAICLALYGRTPRLSRISKRSNEIMTRQTGICFAEVEFETVKGHFRCHWSQHRSRQQPGGELQQPKHEIADAANATILESRIRNVATRVETVTGMDFDRFTRSTLLAQGGFAAFLQATPDKRAPILEQITGTDIYSRLSIKVHELRAREQDKLQELKQALTHINLLDAEEEQELRELVRDREDHSELHKKKCAQTRLKLDWRNLLTKLKKETETYERQLQLIDKEEKGYASRLNQLPLGLAAREIEPIYLAHQALVNSRNKDQAELKRLASSLDELQQREKSTEKDCRLTEQKLLQAELEEKNGQVLIKRVRELDLRLQTAKEQLLERTTILNDLHGQQKDEETALRGLEQKLVVEKARRKKLDIFFRQQAGDERLGEEFSALQMEINSLLHLQEQGAASSQAKEKADRKIQEKREILGLLVKEETTLRHKMTEIKEVLNALNRESSLLLQGRSAETLQQDLFQVQTREKSLEDLLLLLEEHTALTQELESLHGQLSRAAEEENELTTALTLVRKEIAARQQEIRLLEKNLLLLARIQSLETERKHLQEGSPCPLCGATTHPYSQGTIPAISAEEARLEAAKKELTGLEGKNAELTRKEIICRELQSSSRQRINQGRGSLAKKEKTVEQLLSNLELPPLQQLDLELLQEEEKSLILQKETLQQNCEELKKLTKKLTAAEEKEKDLIQTTQNLEKDILKAAHQVSTAEQEQQRRIEEGQLLATELKERTKTLFSRLASYNIKESSPKTFPAILKELDQRTKEWKKKKEEKTLVDTRIVTLGSAIDHQGELLTKLRTEAAEKEKQHLNNQETLDNFARKRNEIFGSNTTEGEEKRLQSAVKDARKNLEERNREYGTITNGITAACTLQEKLKSVNRMRLQEIEEQEITLNLALTASPFADLDQFLTARLHPQELSDLLKLQQELEARKTKAQTLLEDKKKTVHREETKQLCQENDLELQQQLAEQEKELGELLEQAGAARERLLKNDNDKMNALTQLTIIEKQKEILGRWNRLHMLIGSADGKKFRNFAQGLTFEMMINHANNALSRMNNRYILVRDHKVPLDLNVIDTYQAGEVRSTRNLSGGESFLVSLSLALGLSRMASSNVRVDSLFLDEGFGTLDEETLEAALEALSHLREDNKLIGIISHVGALKERIPVQIAITPGAGGRSTMKGPGVRRGN